MISIFISILLHWAFATYTEDLLLIPHNTNTAYAVFTFSWKSPDTTFPPAITTLLKHTDSFEINQTYGQVEQDVLQRATGLTFENYGQTIRADRLSTNWDALTAGLSGIACGIPGKPIYFHDYIYAFENDYLCKENLTRVFQLLPCRDSTGLAVLIKNSNLFKSPYLSFKLRASRSGEFTIHIALEVPADRPFPRHTREEGSWIATTVTMYNTGDNETHTFSNLHLDKLKLDALETPAVQLMSESKITGYPFDWTGEYLHRIRNLSDQRVNIRTGVFFSKYLTPHIDGLKYPHGTYYGYEVDVNPYEEKLIRIKFTKHLTSFEDYPNDPHRGLDFPRIPMLLTWDEGDDQELSGDRLLVMYPEPDFSMPFNVICLIGGIYSFLFSAIHNNALWKEPTHWSSDRHEREVVFAENLKSYLKNAFLVIVFGILFVLDHYGVVKLFG